MAALAERKPGCINPFRDAGIVALVILGALLGGTASASEPCSAQWRHPLRAIFTPYPEGQSYGPPGPQRYPQYAGGNYPWYGYGFGVPTYSWGYFGVHPHPAGSSGFHGYHDDYYQWSFQRGY